jgi:hypothetical protein
MGTGSSQEAFAETGAKPSAVQLKPIRTYAVKVEGFPESLYSARSPAKARAQAYYAFTSAYDVSFKGFLKISSVRRADNPYGIGERILVAGLPATRVIGYGQYTHFMRDDSDVILCAHPSDVSAVPEQAAEAPVSPSDAVASTPSESSHK